MKLFGWMASPNDGCSTLRIMRPLDAVETHCHDVRVEYGTVIDSDLPYDVVIGQRIATANPSYWWQLMAQMPDRPRMVYEIDDDFFHIDPDNTNAYDAYMNPETHKRIKDNLHVADTVVVSTERLAEQVSRYNADVRVMPNCIPDYLLTFDKPEAAAKLTIGWGGSPTHTKDMDEIRRELKRYRKRSGNPGLSFHLIGTDYRQRLGIDHARYTPWSESPEGYWHSIDFDIGLCPLADTIFNEAKSDIKLLEYNALGIPALCSNVPAYADSITSGAGGWLVDRDYGRGWAQSLRGLANDREAREELGRRGRQWASARTFEHNADAWLQAWTTPVHTSGATDGSPTESSSG